MVRHNHNQHLCPPCGRRRTAGTQPCGGHRVCTVIKLSLWVYGTGRRNRVRWSVHSSGWVSMLGSYGASTRACCACTGSMDRKANEADVGVHMGQLFDHRVDEDRCWLLAFEGRNPRIASFRSRRWHSFLLHRRQAQMSPKREPDGVLPIDPFETRASSTTSP